MENKYAIFNTPLPMAEPSSMFRAFEKAFDSDFFDMFNPRVFPHYNIVQIKSIDEHTESSIHRIDFAVSGYSSDILDIHTDDKHLYVESKGDSRGDDNPTETVLHKGISTKSFRLKFKLSRNTRVVSATLADGILSVTLETKEQTETRHNIEIEDVSVSQMQLLQE